MFWLRAALVLVVGAQVTMSQKPPLVCVDDYRAYAEANLTPMVQAYHLAASDDELTYQDNIDAFRRYLILPHNLRNVTVTDMTSSILGIPTSLPIFFSPSAMQKMVHYVGEIGSAQAAAALGTGVGLSTYTTTSLEDVAAANDAASPTGKGLRFFQMYVSKNRSISTDHALRAQAAGYAAIAVTVDAPEGGRLRQNRRLGYTLTPPLRFANFPQSVTDNIVPSQALPFIGGNMDKSFTWQDITWLKKLVPKMKIIVKGITRASEVENALKSGADAIWVSNHGGRAIDTAPATLDALVKVVKAVKGRCEVYIDGGIREGSDVFKAIALGAKAVFVGRPVIYGLSYDGENGAQQVLQILSDELKHTMLMAGITNIAGITPDMVIRKADFIDS